MTIPAWQTAVAEKRRDFDEQLAATGYPVPQVKDSVLDVSTISLDGLLSARQVEITDLAPEVLVAEIAKGAYSAVEVTEAFCRRAVIAHKLTNCLNVIFFEKALARAKELDEHYAKTGKTVGPLHGLPISLKNQCNVADVEMNMDYVGWVGRISKENGAMAEILLKQGAVLYVLTNMSQALFSSDSVNNLYGRTVSPFNRKLAVGGSSGGEGALVALRGSPLGIGSDLGGSVRVPASYNGLFGFRSSWHRSPYGGSTNSQLGQEAVPSILGPHSPSAQGLTLFFKSVLEGEPWLIDPMAPRMPWNQALYQLAEHGEGKEPLCFGFQWDNGDVKPNPPYYRAMEMVKAALTRAGHKVIDWTFPDTVKQQELLLDVYLADNGVDVAEQCAISGEPVLGGVLAGIKRPEISVADYHKLTFACRQSATKVLRAWAATAELTGTGRPFDAIITPTAPYPSFVPGQEQYIMYTGVSNLNDLPTSTFPVTRVDASQDSQVAAHDFRSKLDKDIYERYDPELYQGMPIGLQVIGRRGEDEAVLKMTEMIAGLLKGSA